MVACQCTVTSSTRVAAQHASLAYDSALQGKAELAKNWLLVDEIL